MFLVDCGEGTSNQVGTTAQRLRQLPQPRLNFTQENRPPGLPSGAPPHNVRGTLPRPLSPQLRRAGHLQAAAARAVFVTHMHGDHCFGVGGVLAAALEARRGMPQQREPLLLFGPPELQSLVLAAVRWGAAARRSMSALARLPVRKSPARSSEP